MVDRASMEIEHLLPCALGGLTAETNLWLACSLCNEYKGARIVAIDPISDLFVALFNPRQQDWHEHFAWNAQSDLIIGLTATGRATVAGSFTANLGGG